MARYTDALCRICRRSGEKLFLKGIRCATDKCAIERRKYPPGQHGQGRGKLSDYGVHLAEKQKVRKYYGMTENQFRNYFEKASAKKGITGENLLQMLERRLDSMVFRMGFALNIRQARQLVSHGHFLVNGRATNVPSCLVRPNDIISVKEAKRNQQVFADNMAIAEHRGVAGWVEVDMQQLKGKVVRIPTREEISLPVQEQLIVEFYSK